jgi:hypothetical protein
MDWLEHRHCAVCGQYICNDREYQSALCVCSACGERKGPYDFAEAEHRGLGATRPCERCMKAHAFRELEAEQRCYRDLIHKKVEKC